MGRDTSGLKPTVKFDVSNDEASLDVYFNKETRQIRDLTAATGLVIILKLHSNCPFFARMTSKFDGWPRQIMGHLLYATSELCASFQSHQWIQTRVIVRKRPIRVKRVTVQKCPIWVKIDYFFHRVTLKFDAWPWKNNRAPLLCCFKLCASFHSHQWIQTRVIVWKRPIRVKIHDFSCPVWPWNLMNDLKKQ